MPTDVINRPMSHFNGDFTQQLSSEKQNNDPLAYQNLTIVKKLSKGKFPVYLVNSKINNQNYAMKVFTENVRESDVYYQNELRFSFLKHPNIINTVSSDNNNNNVQKNHFLRMSYVLSEYAPHGDLFDFIVNNRAEFDEKLARTFFRQLISGIEYLHTLGIAHLDLKPENLLIGADFNLKIADFDLSYVASDEKVLSKGTKLYRAPELYNATKDSELDHPSAADIYSAGIILFILKCAGVYPHSENKVIEGVNFTELMEKNSSKFWSKHCEIQEKSKSFFDSKFKDLFSKMVKTNPEKRLTIKKIKESKWYNGAVYTQEELTQRMKAILKC